MESCHVERSETSLLDSMFFGFRFVGIFFSDSLLGYFFQGGQGELLACVPYYMILIANALHLLLVCRFAPNAALTPNP